MSSRAVGLVARLLFCVGLCACRAPRSVAHVADAMPDTIGALHAVGEAKRTETGARVTYVRRYAAEHREATLRATDVTAHRELASAFQTTLSLASDTLDELAKPTSVGGERAALSWSRATGESAVEVLVADRVLLSFNVWPADAKDDAERLFPDDVVRAARELAETR